MVELAEDEHHEDVAGGDDALRVGFLDGFEAGEGAVVVEVVEVLVGLANLRGEIDGIGVGIDGLGEGRQRNNWQCEGDDEKDGGEDGRAAGLQNHSLPDGVRNGLELGPGHRLSFGQDGEPVRLLDGCHRKLYPSAACDCL